MQIKVNIPPEKINNYKYSSLDGLRAYATIGIVMMHVLSNIVIKPESNYLIDVIIPYFTNFTFLFMMVSAFSMCCGYYERIKNHQIAPSEFYQKRYKRVLPFFALMVMIDLVWEHNISALYESFTDLTLCFNLLPNPDIKVIGVGWFIGIVFLFYMLYPFFVFLMDNKKRAWKVLALSLIFCYIAVSYFSTDKYVVTPIGRSNMIYSAPYFIVGGIIYLYRNTLSKLVSEYQWITLAICVAVSVALFCFNVESLFVIPSLILFVVWLIYALGSKDKVLNNRFTKYMSKVSMEIYLSHMLLFRVVTMLHLQNYIQNINLLYAVTFVLTLIAATAFSHVCKFYVLPKLGNTLQYIRIKG